METLVTGKSYFELVGAIEADMQCAWEAEGINKVDFEGETSPKRYVLGMFPYPSGNAHMGHILVYSIADCLARLGRFKGMDVLNPIGWDSFGLPAENAAFKNAVHPADWTQKNIEKMRGPQIGRAGFSFSEGTELDTSSPEFYKWTQWLFLKLREHGQVYRANAWVNWDPVDNTVLANEQVINGKGWRSGVPIERRQMEQWYFRITSFAEDLWNGLDQLEGWSDRAIAAQRNWIGRSEGCEIEFPVVGLDDTTVGVFTTRADTIFGVTSLTLAPEHELLDKLVSSEMHDDVTAYVKASILKSEIERQSANEKSGISIGRVAKNPLTGEEIPIFVSDYVLVGYGTGAIMNVPAHDHRDFEFAKLKGLKVRTVIMPSSGETNPYEAFVDDGILVASGDFNGLSNTAARKKIIEHVEAMGTGKSVIRFRLRDWAVSRQRFWGAPIPMMQHQDGKWEPVPLSDLPVKLPKTVDFGAVGGKSPLATSKAFYETVSPTDGSVCRREVDTMDTFMCSAWYAWRFLDVNNDVAPFEIDKSRRWMPIDYYVGGLEHANQHLIYFRYISHFLHSIGCTPRPEPVLNFLDNGMIQKDGAKMSKSLGNVVMPDDIMSRYGADALRFYVMSDTPYERDREWDDSGLAGKQRFLSSVWEMYTSTKEENELRFEPVQPELIDAWSCSLVADLYRLATDTEELCEETQSFHVVVARIHAFSNTLRTAVGEAGTSQRLRVLSFVLQNFLKVLGLFCPHISDRLWRSVFGMSESLFSQPWIPIDDAVLQISSPTLSVTLTVDGKPRRDLTVGAEVSDDELTSLVSMESEELGDLFKGRCIIRTIIVRDKQGLPKLLNVVTSAE